MTPRCQTVSFSPPRACAGPLTRLSSHPPRVCDHAPPPVSRSLTRRWLMRLPPQPLPRTTRLILGSWPRPQPQARPFSWPTPCLSAAAPAGRSPDWLGAGAAGAARRRTHPPRAANGRARVTGPGGPRAGNPPIATLLHSAQHRSPSARR